MHFTKRAVLLTMVLSICLLIGCQSQLQTDEQLTGKWCATIENTRQQALSLLESMELYPEEIALTEDIPLTYVQVVEFTAQGSYRFYLDTDAAPECAASFYRAVFDALYQGRLTLNQCYDRDFTSMTREEFQQFYAQLYVVNDFEALIRQLSATAYDPATLTDATETGTYTIQGDRILCTTAGQSAAEVIGYLVEAQQLTLNFKNGTIVYTQMN